MEHILYMAEELDSRLNAEHCGEEVTEEEEELMVEEDNSPEAIAKMQELHPELVGEIVPKVDDLIKEIYA